MNLQRARQKKTKYILGTVCSADFNLRIKMIFFISTLNKNVVNLFRWTFSLNF